MVQFFLPSVVYIISTELFQSGLKFFLEDIVQSRSIGNTLSEKIEVIRGIPQGSVLRPIVFLIYINYIPSIVDSCTTDLPETKIQRKTENCNLGLIETVQ